VETQAHKLTKQPNILITVPQTPLTLTAGMERLPPHGAQGVGHPRDHGQPVLPSHSAACQGLRRHRSHLGSHRRKSQGAVRCVVSSTDSQKLNITALITPRRSANTDARTPRCQCLSIKLFANGAWPTAELQSASDDTPTRLFPLLLRSVQARATLKWRTRFPLSSCTATAGTPPTSSTTSPTPCRCDRGIALRNDHV